MKLERTQDWREGLPDVTFFCPACECDHGVWVTPNKNILKESCWSFNGNFEKPTFAPSLKITTPTPQGYHICHNIITNGLIHYCNDCTHKFAGQTIELPEIES